jgi:DnaD/phage-associated family protein
MSIEVSNFYWERCPEVKGSERLMILALADYCNEGGWCYPSVPDLSRRCALSDRGTQKILSRLAVGGHIAVEANGGMRRTRGSPTHRYHLLAYQRSKTGAQGEPTCSPCTEDKGEQSATKGAPMRSPLAVEKGEQMRSPCGADKGEQIAQKGEQIDAKGEPTCSPDPYRSISDPNTSADAAAPAPLTNAGDYQKVVAAYHNAIGVLTPILEDEIKDELTRSPRAWVLRAIEIAAMRNHRRWAYVAGILRRWHADGYDGGVDNCAARAAGAVQTGSMSASRTTGKSMGYGRHRTPATGAKGQSIEDYADDPEYYEQLKALYAAGNTVGDIAGDIAGNIAQHAAGVGAG